MRNINSVKSKQHRIKKWDLRLNGAKVYFAGKKGLGSVESYRQFLSSQRATLADKLADKPDVIVISKVLGIPDDVISYVSGGTKAVDSFIFNEDALQDAIKSKSATFWERTVIYFSEDAMEANYEDELIALDAEIVDNLTDGPNLIVIKGKGGRLGNSVLEYISENRNKVMLWGESDFNDILNRGHDDHTSPDVLARSRPLDLDELKSSRVLFTSVPYETRKKMIRVLTEEFGVKTVNNQVKGTPTKRIKQASTYDFMIWNGAERRVTDTLKWAIEAYKQTGKPEIIRASDLLVTLKQGGWEPATHTASVRDLEGPDSTNRSGTNFDVWDNDLPNNVGVFIIPGVFSAGPRKQIYKYMRLQGIKCMETLPADEEDMPEILVVKDADNVSTKENEYIDLVRSIPGAYVNIIGHTEFLTLLYEPTSRSLLTTADPDFDWTKIKGKDVAYFLGNVTDLSYPKARSYLMQYFGAREVHKQIQPGYTGRKHTIYCAFADPRRQKIASLGLADVWGIPVYNEATLWRALEDRVPGYNKLKTDATDDRKPEGRPMQSQIGGGTRDVKGLAHTRGVNRRNKRPDPYRRTRDLAPAPGARNRSRGRSGLAGEVNNPPTRRRAVR